MSCKDRNKHGVCGPSKIHLITTKWNFNFNWVNFCASFGNSSQSLPCKMIIKQENIPVGCVPNTTVPSTSGEVGYTPWVPYPLGIPYLHWVYPTPQVYPPPGYTLLPNTGPGSRIPYPQERTWYQGYPIPLVDRQTPVKTLPSRNFVGGNKNNRWIVPNIFEYNSTVGYILMYKH